MRVGVDCVAVTDHNSGEWIDELKAALDQLACERNPDYRPLYLFPGVEVTANGGIHVLAVLDAGKGSADVAALLGSVAFHGERGAGDVTANKAPIEVVEAIVAAGGIPILAHVDGPSGAWKLTGGTLAPLLDFDGLFAMEVVNTGRKKPELYRKRSLAWPRCSVLTRTTRQVIRVRVFPVLTTPGSRWPGPRWKGCGWRCWTAGPSRFDAAMTPNPMTHSGCRRTSSKPSRSAVQGTWGVANRRDWNSARGSTLSLADAELASLRSFMHCDWRLVANVSWRTSILVAILA